MPHFRTDVACDGSISSPTLLRHSLLRYAYVALGGGHTGVVVADSDKSRFLTCTSAGGGDVRWSVSGSRWISSGQFNTGEPVNLLPACAAESGNGRVVVGGTPASASDHKLRYSGDGGETWSPGILGSADTQGVSAIAYSSSIGLWIASAYGSGLWTSIDGATWINRNGAYGGAAAIIIREGASPFIVVTQPLGFPGGPSSNYMTSPDGVNWTFRTNFPADTYSSFQGCWSDSLGLFLQPNTAGLYSSPDGLNWTLYSAETFHGAVRNYGKYLLDASGRMSLDGITFRRVLETTSNNMKFTVSKNGGVLFVDGTDHFLSPDPDFIP